MFFALKRYLLHTALFFLCRSEKHLGYGSVKATHIIIESSSCFLASRFLLLGRLIVAFVHGIR